VLVADRSISQRPSRRTRVGRERGGANDRLLAIVQRLAKLIDQIVKIRFFYERLRPKTIIKVLLRHRLRPLLGENLQELKRLGREVHPIAVAQQLVAFRIENEIAEADTH